MVLGGWELTERVFYGFWVLVGLVLVAFGTDWGWLVSILGSLGVGADVMLDFVPGRRR